MSTLTAYQTRRETSPLINEVMIRENAPAVFATSPAPHTSGKYSFVPTHRIIRAFEEQGFFTNSAEQVKSRTEEDKMYGKHLIRMQHESVNSTAFVGNAVPEILIFNAHDWSTSYKLKGGVYRFVCSNGMVVCSQEFGDMSRRHKGFDEADIILASGQFGEQMGELSDKIARFQGIELQENQRFEFAGKCALTRFDRVDGDIINSLLTVRRYEDLPNDMWTTFNRIQENVIKGYKPANGRKVRGVTAIDRSMDINARLWGVAESFATALLN